MKKHPILVLLDQVGLDEFECNLALLGRLKKENDLSVLAFFFDRVFSEGFLPFFRKDIDLDLQDSTYPSLMVVLKERIDGFSPEEGSQFFATLLRDDNVVEYFRFFAFREMTNPASLLALDGERNYYQYFARKDWLALIKAKERKNLEKYCIELVDNLEEVNQFNAPFLLAIRDMVIVPEGTVMKIDSLRYYVVRFWEPIDQQLREKGYLK